MHFSKGWMRALAVVAVSPTAASLYAQVNEADPAVAAARAHFASRAAEYGLLNGALDLKARTLHKSVTGVSHIRFEQHFGGIPVFEGQAIAHVDRSGRVVVTNGLSNITPLLATTPVLTRDNAVAIAVQDAGFRGNYDVQSATLEILARGERSNSDRLVWHVKLFAGNDVDGTVARDLFVDATAGRVVWKFDSLETTTGTGNTMWSGTVNFHIYGHYLYDETRGKMFATDLKHRTAGNGTVFQSANDIFGDGNKTNTDPETAGADAYYGAQLTWDFYKNTYGRNGIDNQGRQTYSRVHYGNNYENAYWDNTCFCMTYGDGANTFYTLTALDVTGHEFSHGVMASEAKLTYAGESGGLNESNSDIFGTMVEFSANNAQDPGDYWIGERIYKSNWTNGGTTYTQNKALRYMDDPKKDGASPACWSTNTRRLDVHYSSGANNHFFYLLAEGGGSNCNGQQVTGIGRDKAAAIWYKAMTDYMTANTNYHTALTAVQNAAAELYGNGSPEYNAVTSAYAAINVTN
jgi:Zn-dependent metalloprotease